MAPDRVARMRSALEKLAPTKLDVMDDSAAHVGHVGARGGGHFRVTIVADAFRGRSTLERHRMVYGALGDMLESEIHAVNIVARTPEESV